MGSFFQPGNSIAGRIQKKIIPKELRKAVPKEVNPAYLDKKSAQELGMVPEAPDPIAPPPPPEQIDADAYRVNSNRRRRLARAAGGSTIRTSSTGAAYSAAPKALTGA